MKFAQVGLRLRLPGHAADVVNTRPAVGPGDIELAGQQILLCLVLPSSSIASCMNGNPVRTTPPGFTEQHCLPSISSRVHSPSTLRLTK